MNCFIFKHLFDLLTYQGCHLTLHILCGVIYFYYIDKFTSMVRIESLETRSMTERKFFVFVHQVADDRLRSWVNPQTSVPYVFDEPTLLPFITCSVSGGTTATYSMNSFGEGENICYENFVYIAVTATFEAVADRGGKHCTMINAFLSDVFVSCVSL